MCEPCHELNVWNALRLIKRKRCYTHPFILKVHDLMYRDESLTMVVKQDPPLDYDAPKGGVGSCSQGPT